jgi:surface polysaccharide O-acyltransferase-like enzyme
LSSLPQGLTDVDHPAAVFSSSLYLQRFPGTFIIDRYDFGRKEDDMPKQKIEFIDYLRAFAFLAVVLQHSIGHYAYGPETAAADGVLMGALLLLAKFAVPAFIFITGLVLFYNYRDGVRAGTFYWKRFKDIVLPYLPWAFLYVYLGWIYGPVLPISAFYDKLGLLMLTGTAMYHLWYVVMTCQLYALFPLLRSAVVAIDTRLGRYGLLLLIVLAPAYMWLTAGQGPIGQLAKQTGIPLLGELFDTYADRNALYFLYYFILGAAAGLHYKQWNERLNRYKTAILTAYGLFLGFMLYRIVSHFQFEPELVIHYNDTLLVQPLMAAFLIVSVPAMMLLSQAFGRRAHLRLRLIMAAIGKYSYTAYLAHALVLVAATAIADRLLPGFPVTARMLLATICCAAGSVLLAIALRRLTQLAQKLAQRASGRSGPAKPPKSQAG